MSTEGNDDSALKTATLPTASASAHTQVCWVHAFFGPGDVRLERLDGPLVLGRDTSCEWPVADPAASRQHARLSPSGQRVAIEDLGSHNGTYVDGARIVDVAEVMPPFTLRVGSTLFRVGAQSDALAEARPESPLVGGSSQALLRRQIGLVAASPLSVLILGETGTGKEIVTSELHERSGRGGKLVVVNCPTLPEALVESELFGHVRSAFTGARTARTGLFAQADGGTLFLDEVGDLPLSAQAKLLRVLEDGHVRPVGADKGRDVDVRVVSATNRDLAAMVATGGFRPDLLARLQSVVLRTVPLRDRVEDLPLLCAHLMKRARVSAEVDADAMEALALYAWPMNVRELDSVLRAAVLKGGQRIDIASLPPSIGAAWNQARVRPVNDAPGTVSSEVSPAMSPAMSPAVSPADTAGDTSALSRLQRALADHSGNVSKACESAGLSRSHAYRLMRRHDVDPKSFREKESGT